jgi:hypothetical protein
VAGGLGLVACDIARALAMADDPQRLRPLLFMDHFHAADRGKARSRERSPEVAVTRAEVCSHMSRR